MTYCKFRVVGQKVSFKERVHEALQNFGIWWNDNKEWAIIVLPVAVGLGSWAIKSLIKGSVSVVKGLIQAHNLKLEEAIKNLYCYDRSLGHYWKLTRELSANEWLAVEARKKAGETLGHILMDMKVI